MSIEFEIHHPMITKGAGAWRGKEDHIECIEAIKTAAEKVLIKSNFNNG